MTDPAPYHDFSPLKQALLENLTPACFCSPHELTELETEWELLRQSAPQPFLDQHLGALSLKARTHNLRVITLHSCDRLVAAAPLLIFDPWHLRWNFPLLTHRPVVQFSLRLADLCGPNFIGADHEAVAASLLKLVCDSCKDCDAIRFNQLRYDSTIRSLLSQAPHLRRSWWLWKRKEDDIRWLIQLNGLFDDYLQKFSRKTRKNIQREARLLAKYCGSLSLICVTERDQVGSFVEAARLIAAHSWQSMSFRPGRLALLEDYAAKGWLKSYLLLAGGRPTAYIVGWESDGVFLVEETAFDSRLARLSPGKVLMAKTIEDLFAGCAVKWLDFGTSDIGYKKFWANASHCESRYFLVRKSLRNAAIFWPKMAIRSPLKLTRRVSALAPLYPFLDRLAYKASKALRQTRQAHHDHDMRN